MTSDRDKGSVTLWLVIFTLAVLVLLSFVVDGGQYMNARERAADIAQQASRAAADSLSIQDLRRDSFVIPASACDANGPAATLVSAYAGGATDTTMSGCVVGTLTDGGVCDPPGNPPGARHGHCVKVTVDVTMTPVIPVGVFGTFTVPATEQATLDCGTDVALTGFC